MATVFPVLYAKVSELMSLSARMNRKAGLQLFLIDKSTVLTGKPCTGVVITKKGDGRNRNAYECNITFGGRFI